MAAGVDGMPTGLAFDFGILVRISVKYRIRSILYRLFVAVAMG